MLTTTVSLKICDIKYVLNILPTTIFLCTDLHEEFFPGILESCEENRPPGS
ncbi:hypothetical protein Peur_046891 [Populus x canadensis]